MMDHDAALGVDGCGTFMSWIDMWPVAS
jgi:hypothetical protein